jgi:hypothetical protein
MYRVLLLFNVLLLILLFLLCDLAHTSYAEISLRQQARLNIQTGLDSQPSFIATIDCFNCADNGPEVGVYTIPHELGNITMKIVIYPELTELEVTINEFINRYQRLYTHILMESALTSAAPSDNFNGPVGPSGTSSEMTFGKGNNKQKRALNNNHHRDNNPEKYDTNTKQMHTSGLGTCINPYVASAPNLLTPFAEKCGIAIRANDPTCQYWSDNIQIDNFLMNNHQAQLPIDGDIGYLYSVDADGNKQQAGNCSFSNPLYNSDGTPIDTIGASCTPDLNRGLWYIDGGIDGETKTPIDINDPNTAGGYQVGFYETVVGTAPCPCATFDHEYYRSCPLNPWLVRNTQNSSAFNVGVVQKCYYIPNDSPASNPLAGITDGNGNLLASTTGAIGVCVPFIHKANRRDLAPPTTYTTDCTDCTASIALSLTAGLATGGILAIPALVLFLIGQDTCTRTFSNRDDEYRMYTELATTFNINNGLFQPLQVQLGNVDTLQAAQNGYINDANNEILGIQTIDSDNLQLADLIQQMEYNISQILAQDQSIQQDLYSQSQLYIQSLTDQYDVFNVQIAGINASLAQMEQTNTLFVAFVNQTLNTIQSIAIQHQEQAQYLIDQTQVWSQALASVYSVIQDYVVGKTKYQQIVAGIQQLLALARSQDGWIPFVTDANPDGVTYAVVPQSLTPEENTLYPEVTRVFYMSEPQTLRAKSFSMVCSVTSVLAQTANYIDINILLANLFQPMLCDWNDMSQPISLGCKCVVYEEIQSCSLSSYIDPILIQNRMDTLTGIQSATTTDYGTFDVSFPLSSNTQCNPATVMVEPVRILKSQTQVGQELQSMCDGTTNDTVPYVFNGKQRYVVYSVGMSSASNINVLQLNPSIYCRYDATSLAELNVEIQAGIVTLPIHASILNYMALSLSVRMTSRKILEAQFKIIGREPRLGVTMVEKTIEVDPNDSAWTLYLQNQPNYDPVNVDRNPTPDTVAAVQGPPVITDEALAQIISAMNTDRSNPRNVVELAFIATDGYLMPLMTWTAVNTIYNVTVTFSLDNSSYTSDDAADASNPLAIQALNELLANYSQSYVSNQVIGSSDLDPILDFPIYVAGYMGCIFGPTKCTIPQPLPDSFAANYTNAASVGFNAPQYYLIDLGPQDICDSPAFLPQCQGTVNAIPWPVSGISFLNPSPGTINATYDGIAWMQSHGYNATNPIPRPDPLQWFEFNNFDPSVPVPAALGYYPFNADFNPDSARAPLARLDTSVYIEGTYFQMHRIVCIEEEFDKQDACIRLEKLKFYRDPVANAGPEDTWTSLFVQLPGRTQSITVAIPDFILNSFHQNLATCPSNISVTTDIFDNLHNTITFTRPSWSSNVTLTLVISTFASGITNYDSESSQNSEGLSGTSATPLSTFIIANTQYFQIDCSNNLIFDLFLPGSNNAPYVEIDVRDCNLLQIELLRDTISCLNASSTDNNQVMVPASEVAITQVLSEVYTYGFLVLADVAITFNEQVDNINTNLDDNAIWQPPIYNNTNPKPSTGPGSDTYVPPVIFPNGTSTTTTPSGEVITTQYDQLLDTLLNITFIQLNNSMAVNEAQQRLLEALARSNEIRATQSDIREQLLNISSQEAALFPLLNQDYWDNFVQTSNEVNMDIITYNVTMTAMNSGAFSDLTPDTFTCLIAFGQTPAERAANTAIIAQKIKNLNIMTEFKANDCLINANPGSYFNFLCGSLDWARGLVTVCCLFALEVLIIFFVAIFPCCGCNRRMNYFCCHKERLRRRNSASEESTKAITSGSRYSRLPKQPKPKSKKKKNNNHKQYTSIVVFDDM